MANDPQGLRTLLEPVIEALNYELVYIEQTQNQTDPLLRFYIDAPGGILLEDCEQVSRQISLVMDLEDPISGHYVLEVSSPGTDRPLVKLSHFEQVVGEEVRIQSSDYILGRRRFKGKLLSTDNEILVLNIDGEEYEIPVSSVDTARVVPNFDNV